MITWHTNSWLRETTEAESLHVLLSRTNVNSCFSLYQRHVFRPLRNIYDEAFWESTCFFISNTFMSNTRFKLAKIKQMLSTKLKFFIKDFFSKCDQICSFLWIWSHLLKKSFMENFIFCAVHMLNNTHRLNFYYLKISDMPHPLYHPKIIMGHFLKNKAKDEDLQDHEINHNENEDQMKNRIT